MARPAPAALLALFRTADDVADALDRLRGLGLPANQYTVLSGCPYPEGAFGEETPKGHLFVFPLVGAACGLAIGIFLTVGTQIAYPLVTGGKPILSIPPMINVLYEGMLLGAIVLTVIGMLFEMRLPDFSRAPYDSRIFEGYLGVLVSGSDDSVNRARQALVASGAVDVIAGVE